MLIGQHLVLWPILYIRFSSGYPTRTMSIQSNLLAVACTTALLGSASSFAQQATPSIDLGGLDLSPSVNIEFISNSNAFLTPDDETDTTGGLVSPRLELQGERRLLQIGLVYQGDYATFSEDNLDYDDHLLRFNANAELGVRKRLSGSLSISKDHQTLGTRLTRGIADENTDQVEFTEAEAEFSFFYGAQAARGNIEVGLELGALNFLNQESITNGADFTSAEPFAVFSYRISSDTRVFVEGRFGQFSFDDEIRDHDDLSAFAGVALGGSGKTNGTAQLGFTQASFDDRNTGDQEILVADVLLSWRPSGQSQFDLILNREFDNTDTNASGELTVSDTVRLDWIHDWSSRVRTNAFVSNVADNRECPNIDSDIFSAGVRLGVAVRRWLEIGAGFQTSSRTSGSCPVADTQLLDLDFDQQRGSIFLKATL